MKKKVFIGVSVIITIAIVAGGLLFVMFITKPDIVGSISKQECDISNSEMSIADNEYYITQSLSYMNMSYEQRQSFQEHPNEYSYYKVELNIKNISAITLYNMKASLNRKYNDLWLNESTICESNLNLEPNEEYSIKLGILLRTDDKNEKQISDEIASIILKLKYSPIEALQRLPYKYALVKYKN